MGPGIASFEVMAVVGRNEGQARLSPQSDQGLVHDGLFRNAVGLKFQVEVPRPEDLGILEGAASRSLEVVAQDVTGDFPFEAAGEPDEPLAVPAQELLVDARLVVKSLEGSRRDKLHEVLVSREIPGQ